MKSPLKMKDSYPHIMPDLTQWPIYKLSEDRHNFVEEVENETVHRLHEKYGDGLFDLLEKSIYLEKIRIKDTPWRVDPPNEALFYKKLQNKLNKNENDYSHEELQQVQSNVLHTLVKRYVEEIVGTFKISTFGFARRFLTFLFSRLLGNRIFAGLSLNSSEKLREKLKLYGEVDTLRALFEKGTVIVVPTHFSNLDSIMIGYILDKIAGLPGFSYGAGLNLYNNGIAAFFMNRLGAYRLDRRKKNAVYLETLKSMSYLSLVRGTNTIFFPGGTRSRSGALEDKLKLGLIGSAIEAQRQLVVKPNQANPKIFIVPVVLGYHFVLEAQSLIDQHLKMVGREKFIRNKHSKIGVRSILRYIWNLYWHGSEIIVSVGKPMDVIGNFVNNEGESHDARGNKVDIKDYFKLEDHVEPNAQRETEYTKLLAERISEEFHNSNIVLSSHLVAFAAFRYLLHEYEKMDLFAVLKQPVEDFQIPPDIMVQLVDQIRYLLTELNAQGRIKLSYEFDQPTEELIKMGINKLGVFHRFRPLKYNKAGYIVSEDFHLLLYYHNKLIHYDLENQIHWNTIGTANSLNKKFSV